MFCPKKTAVFLASILVLCALFTSLFVSPAFALSKPAFPVIFIHGIASNADDTWGPFRDFLTSQGWTFGGAPFFDPTILAVTGVNGAADFYTMNFSDSNAPDFRGQNLTLERQGMELDAVITAVLAANLDKTRVVLVGHSMGGLAARNYLQGLARLGSLPIPYRDNVSKLITIGTPHSGTELAVMCQAFLSGNVCILLPNQIDPNSAAVALLRPDSDALLTLNNLLANPLPLDVLYTSIQGTGTPVILFGGDGDGIVSTFSQNLGNIAGAGNLIHESIPTFIVDRSGCDPDFNNPLIPNETHTCETSDKGVWAELLNQFRISPVSTLSFPLAGFNAYTAPISSVVDHSSLSSGGFYSASRDNGVVAYTGELGKDSCGPSGPPCGFLNPSNNNFIVNGTYVGVNADGVNKLKVLNYEGHPGYDYPCVEGVDNILAAAEGDLSIPSFDPINLPSGADPHTRFNALRIIHGGGWETWYLHAMLGTEGSPRHVVTGQPIAKCGRTGVPSSHLHFEVRRNGKIIDPYGWEWNTGDPISANTQASVQLDPLWGISQPIVNTVTLTPSSSGGGFIEIHPVKKDAPIRLAASSSGFTATITGQNFAANALVTLWDRYGQFFVQAITPSPSNITATQIVADLPSVDALGRAFTPENYVLKVKNPSGPRSRGVALSSSPSTSAVPLALIGQPAPGGGAFSSFCSFYDMNNRGDIIFCAEVDLNGDGTGDVAGTFNFSSGQFTKVTAPGFTQIGAAKINNLGDMAFGDASVPGRTQAIYFLKAGSSTPIKIAEWGQPSPISGTTWYDPRGPVALSDNGKVVFWSGVINPSTNTLSWYVFLYSYSDGSVIKVVGNGDGPTPIGGTFGDFGRMGLTADGDVIVGINVNGGSSPFGIFLFTPSVGFKKIVAVGDPAPSNVGGTLGPGLSFASTKSISGRQFVFLAAVTGGVTDQAIFVKDDIGLQSSANIRVVAYEGQATNTETGGTFSNGLSSGNFPLEIYDGGPQIRADGGVLFLSQLNGAHASDGSPTKKGIFLWTGKEFKKVVVEGDPVPSGGKLNGVSSHILNDIGQVVYFVAGIK
jgi:triacylglycerol lipase